MTRLRLLIAQIALLAISAALICIGITSGELAEIMQKAVIVCLECIGIG